VAAIVAAALASFVLVGGIAHMARGPEGAPETKEYAVTLLPERGPPAEVQEAPEAPEHEGVLGALRDDPSTAQKSLLLQQFGTVGDPGNAGVTGDMNGLVGGGGGQVGEQAGSGGLGMRGEPAPVRAKVKAEHGRVGRKEARQSYGQGYEGDGYAYVAENDFHRAADTPLSTFSVDVDTASYANVRRYLVDDAILPPSGAVRIEELVNYFDYDYAPPTDGAPFATHVELTDCPWAAGHQLARVGIQGRMPTAASTPPRNLVFLVDVSGSMSGPDRLPLAQEGLKLLAGQLGPRDRVSMVVYAGAAGVVLEPTPGNRHAEIAGAVDRLRSGGSTAGAEGIQLAYALARKHYQKGAINRVVLATDGDFNVGVSSDDELVRIVEEERRHGVFLTVLGFGRGNLQDAKMEQLADKGNGNYAYIDGLPELRKVLGTEIGATLQTIAKDVKIQVEFNPLLVGSYRLLGYENRTLAARDFNDDTKDAGEVGAGHEVTALYEIVPVGADAPSRPEVDPLKYQGAFVPSAAASENELMTVKVRYKAPDGDVSRLVSTVVPALPVPFASASRDTRWAAAVVEFGMLLRQSPHRGTASWAHVQQTAARAVGSDEDGLRGQFLTLVGRAMALDRG